MLVEAVLREIVAAIGEDRAAEGARVRSLCSGLARAQLATYTRMGSPRLAHWKALRFVPADPPELFVEVGIAAAPRRFAIPKPQWMLGFRRVSRVYAAIWKLGFAPDTQGRWILVSAFAKRELEGERPLPFLAPADYE